MRRPLAAILAAFLALIVAGCGSSTPTIAPSASPPASPTATASPSASPTVSASVGPSQVPSEPPIATFPPITLKGTGDGSPKFTLPQNVSALAVISNTGAGTFIVQTVAADGTTIETLVADDGAYHGTLLFDAKSGDNAVGFTVVSGGAWTIVVRPVSAARLWNGTGTVKGVGSDVLLVRPPTSAALTATLTHTGSSAFTVTDYTTAGDITTVLDVTGSFNGKEQLGAGTGILQVEADGSWSIAVTP